MLTRPASSMAVGALDSDLDPVTEETSSTTASSVVTPDAEDLRVPSASAAATNASPSKKARRAAAGKKRVPGPASTTHHRALIIFDWDDTILPTSFLAKKGYKLDSPDPSPEVRAVLTEYSKYVNSTLNEASKRGHVMIVTNAETGWIHLTVEKFLPLCSSVVNKFQHISARSMFEPTGVLTPIAWKESAFRMVVEEYLKAMSGGGMCQVISLGDSAHEREAVLKVCEEFKHQVICKSLKFMERPDIDSLKKEHQLIQECIDEIVACKDNMDLCIQTSTPETSPESSPSKPVGKQGKTGGKGRDN